MSNTNESFVILHSLAESTSPDKEIAKGGYYVEDDAFFTISSAQ